MNERPDQERPTDEQMLRVVMRAAELLTYTQANQALDDEHPDEHDAESHPPKPRKTQKLGS